MLSFYLHNVSASECDAISISRITATCTDGVASGSQCTLACSQPDQEELVGEAVVTCRKESSEAAPIWEPVLTHYCQRELYILIIESINCGGHFVGGSINIVGLGMESKLGFSITAEKLACKAQEDIGCDSLSPQNMVNSPPPL